MGATYPPHNPATLVYAFENSTRKRGAHIVRSALGRRDTFAHVGKPEGTRLFAGWRRPERVGLQGPNAADDCQHVR